ncbi:MAG: MBL fold metallo-hydrolase, partial [Pseudomonadota bacterium]
ESVAPILFLKRDGEYVDSPVQDDQSLFFKTNKGLVVVAGCAHRGVINTTLHARVITGIEDVFMVIGGIHLLNTSDLQQQETLEYFNALNIQKIGVSHCTGMKAAGFLAQNLGFDRFFYNNAGTSISFDQEDQLSVRAFEKYD